MSSKRKPDGQQLTSPITASSSPVTTVGESSHNRESSHHREKRFCEGSSPGPESVIQEAQLTDHATLMSMPLTVVIFGATGDLAKKKLFPSLYQLTLLGQLPRDLNIVGYGRSAVDMPAFLAKQCVNIVEDVDGDNVPWPKADFCSRIQFHAGAYDAASSYVALDEEMRAYEKAHPSGKPGNRLFFLSVPPTVFGTVAEMISHSARASEGGFTRLMIEKPASTAPRLRKLLLLLSPRASKAAPAANSRLAASKQSHVTPHKLRRRLSLLSLSLCLFSLLSLLALCLPLLAPALRHFLPPLYPVWARLGVLRGAQPADLRPL